MSAPAPIHPEDVAARERQFDQAVGTPAMPHPLAALEALGASNELSKAAAARGWSVSEETAWRRTCAARSVLRAELEGSFEELLRDPARGAVSAKLYATWAGFSRAEPFTETAYMLTGIYADLEAAMNSHGLDTFEERCAEIGRKLVEGAITYVLDHHKKDAEAVLEEYR